VIRLRGPVELKTRTVARRPDPYLMFFAIACFALAVALLLNILKL
jgi:hypothetical protein